MKNQYKVQNLKSRMPALLPGLILMVSAAVPVWGEDAALPVEAQNNSIAEAILPEVPEADDAADASIEVPEVSELTEPVQASSNIKPAAEALDAPAASEPIPEAPAAEPAAVSEEVPAADTVPQIAEPASAEPVPAESTAEEVKPAVETPVYPQAQAALEPAVADWKKSAEKIGAIRAKTAPAQSSEAVSVSVAKPKDEMTYDDVDKNMALTYDPNETLEEIRSMPEAASADSAVPADSANTKADSARVDQLSDTKVEIFAKPKEVVVGPNDVMANDALTKLPVGAGFDATVSANTQGKLVKLGVEAKNEDGTPKLDESGNPVIIPLRRGMTVKAGDVLGVQFNQEYIARKDAAERRLIVADKESKKVLEIDVAELASLVAKSELDRAYQANRDMPGSVAEQEVVKLAYEYNRSYKAWEKAKYDLDIKADELEVSKAEISIADAQLEERKLISPIDGQVDDIYQNEGEWLREGDEVFRVIRLDRIAIEARFDSSITSPDRIQGKKATVYASRPGEPIRQFEGTVTYARPIIEHNRFTAYVEVQNEKTDGGSWYFIPGFHVYVVVHP